MELVSIELSNIDDARGVNSALPAAEEISARENHGDGRMKAKQDYVWTFVPHQHQGVAEHSGENDHIHSPKKHNGAFKSRGLATFMGAPYCPPDRKAIRADGRQNLLPRVPWDQGQIVRAGTSQGASGLREATTQYFPYMFEYDVDILTFFKVVDCGDIPNVPGNNAKSHDLIDQYVSECLEGGAKVIMCGGDHSLPIPGIARPVPTTRRRGQIGYLHVDAHLDAGPDWAGNKITNCSGPVARASNFPTAPPKTWRIWARATASTRRTGGISTSITTSASSP